ncbi:MAG: hypothetical protein RLZZ241_774 [Bacteroidota bacterium]|jgi:multidrug efflux pump subunit AcrA (membrane-fusion protein)
MKNPGPIFFPILKVNLLALLLTACGEKEQFITPDRQTIVESVYASATVQPEGMYRAFAAVTGILEANLVEEGDLVRPGTTLIKVSNHAPELNSQNAKLQMNLAESSYLGTNSSLKDLANQIKIAELTYRDDSLNLERQQKLWNQKIGSLATYENRKLSFERSKNILAQLKSEYNRLEIELRTKMAQARNTYAASKANTEDFYVKSTLNGKVYALFKEPGEVVMPNEPLAMLGSPDTFLIELLVDEVDVVRIALEQHVLISLDAYGNQVFEAKISKIYPQKDQRSQTFRVEAQFREAPKTLYPGLSGEANIIIDQRENALTIPRSYLIGKDSVRTIKGLKKIETGLRTLDRIEVRSGLNPYDKLILPE